MRLLHVGIFVAAAAIAVGAAGCRSKTPLYYLMAPQVRAEGRAGTSQISIGIGPVVFPEHLNRTHLVHRLSAGRLMLLEFHRWAEPLQANFTSAVAENLAALIGTERIMIYPWEGGGTPDVNLYVRVLRFEFDPEGAVVLSAIWSLTDKTGKVIALRHKSYRAQSRKTDYEYIVEAMSEATASLSRDVASHITGNARVSRSSPP